MNREFDINEPLIPAICKGLLEYGAAIFAIFIVVCILGAIL